MNKKAKIRAFGVVLIILIFTSFVRLSSSFDEESIVDERLGILNTECSDLGNGTLILKTNQNKTEYNNFCQDNKLIEYSCENNTVISKEIICEYGCKDISCIECFDKDNDNFLDCENDCDDSNPNINPGASEICGNSIDENCDGSDLECEQNTTEITGEATFEIKSLPGTSKIYVYYKNNIIESINQDDIINYYHQDLQKNIVLVTDDQGNLVTSYDYLPFGELIQDNQISNYKFSGKELDLNGLYYYGARVYDKSLGRFTSTDPKFDPTQDPYSYTKNNPLKYTDPDGKDAEVVNYLKQQSNFVDYLVTNIMNYNNEVKQAFNRDDIKVMFSLPDNSKQLKVMKDYNWEAVTVSEPDLKKLGDSKNQVVKEFTNSHTEEANILVVLRTSYLDDNGATAAILMHEIAESVKKINGESNKNKRERELEADDKALEYLEDLYKNGVIDEATYSEAKLNIEAHQQRNMPEPIYIMPDTVYVTPGGNIK